MNGSIKSCMINVKIGFWRRDVVLYDKKIGRDANKGTWDTPVIISNQRVNWCYGSFNTYALMESDWMEGTWGFN